MMASRVQVIFVALLTAGCAGQRQAPTVRQPSSFDFREPPAWFVSAPQAGAARLVDPGREANIHVVVSVVEPGALTGTEGKLADLLASCGPIAGKSVEAIVPPDQASVLRRALLAADHDAEVTCSQEAAAGSNGKALLRWKGEARTHAPHDADLAGYFLVDSVVQNLVTLRYEIRLAWLGRDDGGQPLPKLTTTGGRAQFVHGESYVRVSRGHEREPPIIILLETTAPKTPR
jgi:hypothetical protein